jgi:hypothetical protein
MTKSEWLDLTVLERKKYNLLSEVMDVSQQMGEALDRSDDVSVRMLVALRQEPILHLEEVRQTAAARLESLAAEDRERVGALREGAAPQGTDEEAYCTQAGNARRLLERVLELDRRLSRRLAGDNSFYAQEK